MIKLFSIEGVDITQKNFQQILIRGDGKDQFNQIINQVNLKINTDHKKVLLQKQERQTYGKILDFTPAIPMLIKLIGIVKYGSCHYSPYHFDEKTTATRRGWLGFKFIVSMLIFITTHY